MANYDIQKFARLAHKAGLINLDKTLAEVIESEAIGSIAGSAVAWEEFCGNDLRFFVWPGPRGYLEGITNPAALAETLKGR
jgi:hypothetical protein